jgi:hypothetical protein
MVSIVFFKSSIEVVISNWNFVGFRFGARSTNTPVGKKNSSHQRLWIPVVTISKGGKD